MLSALAAEAGYSYDNEDQVLFIAAPESFAPELNKRAFERGITLSLLQITLPTLEESFFEITGGEK